MGFVPRGMRAHEFESSIAGHGSPKIVMEGFQQILLVFLAESNWCGPTEGGLTCNKWPTICDALQVDTTVAVMGDLLISSLAKRWTVYVLNLAQPSRRTLALFNGLDICCCMHYFLSLYAWDIGLAAHSAIEWHYLTQGHKDWGTAVYLHASTRLWPGLIHGGDTIPLAKGRLLKQCIHKGWDTPQSNATL